MNREKEVTIYDIAKALNISPATVSRGLKDHPAISKNTKKRIFDAAKTMGYRFNTFASNLRLQKTNTIGVIVPRLNSSFMSEAIAGMEKVANETGYNLIISQSLETAEKEIKNAETMFNSRVDGLLVSLAYDTESIHHYEQFIERNIPVLFFDRIFTHPKCPAITIDNYQAGYEMTAHLISQGCRRILHITANQSRNVYLDRYKGYRTALDHHRIPFTSDMLLINDLSSAAGVEVAHHLLSMEKLPDAVFSANDTCAVACLLELKKNGIKIPQDVAFAGFNNDPISQVVEPHLSTVNYKGYEMGQTAAQTLIEILKGNFKFSLSHSLLLKHEVLIRASSLKSMYRGNSCE